MKIKNKRLILLVIVILTIMAFIPIVAAATINDGVVFMEGNRSADASKTTISSEVFSADEKVVKKDEIVNGNVFLAGNDVELSNEIINGDTFIFANNVKIESDTIVNGNVYICAANVNIDGTITRGVYIAAKDVVLSENSSIKYDAYLFTERLIISGTLDRNVNVATNNFEIKDSAIILENLNYTSDKEATIDKEAKINKINFDRKVVEKENLLDIIYKYVIDFAQYFVLTFIILIFMMKKMPNFLEKLKNCINASSFGLGIASIILFPIMLLAMLVFPITTVLAIVGIIILIVIILISMAISNIAIAVLISERNNKIKLPISTALVTTVSWIAYQIPFAGVILAFFMIATGVGIVFKNFCTKSK